MERRTAVALSASAHGGLLVWALVAGWFPSVPEEDSLSVAEVSVISASEFDALVSVAPTDVPAEIVAPAAPTAPPPPEESVAPTPPAEAAPIQTPPPEASAPAPPEAAPDTAQLVPPPRTEVDAETPEAPATPADAPDAPVSARPAPRPAPRIAAQPAPAPPPATETAPVAEAPPAPAEVAEPVAPAEEVAAPEEAAAAIAREDETPSAAPERSMRPGRKPAPPAPRAVASAPAETPAEAAPAPAAPSAPTPRIDTSAALAEALGGGTPAPSGPPLTQGERDGLRVAVSRCWNVGSLSTEAMRTRVTIFMEMTRDGTPLTNTIRLVRFEGGSSASATQAFDAGRRAIIRCGRDGFDLPEEKYEQWKEIEMTFDPEQMRSR